MVREEERKQAAAEHRDVVCCGFYDPIADEKEESFLEGAEWSDKTMLDKACAYLQKALGSNGKTQDLSDLIVMDFVADFRKAMEE